LTRIEEARVQAREARRRDQPAPPSPVVEYLEDSRMSVEYFKMKNSVYFSMIEKDEKTTQKLNANSRIMNDKVPGEEKVKLFNLSAVNQDEFILSSVCFEPKSKGSKRESVVTRTKRMNKQEKELLNFEKKCIICMENLVDAIMSPCHHGGVCFGCAKIALDNKNSCYYCRENVFKVYQVKPSKNNPGFYKVVNAYFIYDQREEHVYEQYANEADDEDEENDIRNRRSQVNRESRQIPSQELGSQSNSVPTPQQVVGQNTDMSNLREWAINSRPPALQTNEIQEPNQAVSAQLSPKSNCNSGDEVSMCGARKRVESFEIEYGGFSKSKSDENVKDEQGQPGKYQSYILRSFDSLNQSEEPKEDREDTPNPVLSNLPPINTLRARIRSNDLGSSKDVRMQLKPIHEEEEHNCD